MHHFQCLNCKKGFFRRGKYYRFCSPKCYRIVQRRLFSESCESRFWKKVTIKSDNECWSWNGSRCANNYGHLTIQHKTWKAYRYSWMIKNGPIPKRMNICHSCNNPPCVNPSHLYLATHKQNMADASRDFLFVHGINHSHARLNPESVREIRKLRDQGVSIPKLCRQFNMSAGAIWAASKRLSWKSVKD